MTKMIKADGCDSKNNSSEDTYDYKHSNEIPITVIMIPSTRIIYKTTMVLLLTVLSFLLGFWYYLSVSAIIYFQYNLLFIEI